MLAGELMLNNFSHKRGSSGSDVIPKIKHELNALLMLAVLFSLDVDQIPVGRGFAG